MKQEDKELLLKDLCARLPYDVKVQYYDNETKKLETGAIVSCTIPIDETNQKYPTFITRRDLLIIQGNTIEDIKPYLFPLSSLTEEQRNDISKLLIDTQNTFSPYGEINTKGCDNLFVCSVKQANAFINYCLMHHLDINGLIEKGLAIDATGLNIY